MPLSDHDPMINARVGYPEEFRELVRQIVSQSNRPRRELAKELGIGYNTLVEWCGPRQPGTEKVLGHKAVERYTRLIQDVRELHWEGYTNVYIAKQVGVPVSTVWDWLNRDHHLGEK
jgi:transposase